MPVIILVKMNAIFTLRGGAIVFVASACIGDSSAAVGESSSATSYSSTADITVTESTENDATALWLTHMGAPIDLTINNIIHAGGQGDGHSYGVRTEGAIGDVNGSEGGAIEATIYGVRKNTADRTVPGKFDFLGDHTNTYGLYAEGGIGDINSGTVIRTTITSDPTMSSTDYLTAIPAGNNPHTNPTLDDFYVDETRPAEWIGPQVGYYILYSVDSSAYGVYSGAQVGMVNADISVRGNIVRNSLSNGDGDRYGGKHSYAIFAEGNVAGIGSEANIYSYARGQGITGSSKGLFTNTSSTVAADAYGVYSNAHVGDTASGALITVHSEYGEGTGIYGNSVGNFAGEINVGLHKDHDNGIYNSLSSSWGIKSNTSVGEVTGKITMIVQSSTGYGVLAGTTIGDFSGEIYFSTPDGSGLYGDNASAHYGLFSTESIGDISGAILTVDKNGRSSDSMGSSASMHGVTTHTIGSYTGIINLERSISEGDSWGLKFEELAAGAVLEGRIDVGSTAGSAYGIWYTGSTALGDVNTIMSGSVPSSLLPSGISIANSQEIRFGQSGSGFGIHAEAGIGDVNGAISVIKHTTNDSAVIENAQATAVYVGEKNSVGDINARLSASSKSGTSVYTLSAGRIGLINDSIIASLSDTKVGFDVDNIAIYLTDSAYTQNITLKNGASAYTSISASTYYNAQSISLSTLEAADFTTGLTAGIHTAGSLGAVSGGIYIQSTAQWGKSYGIYATGNIDSISIVGASSFYKDVDSSATYGSAYAVSTGTITGSISSTLSASITKNNTTYAEIDPHNQEAIGLDLRSNQEHSFALTGNILAKFAMEGYAIGLRAEGSVGDLLGAGSIGASGTFGSSYESEIIGLQTGSITGRVESSISATGTESASTEALYTAEEVIGVKLTASSAHDISEFRGNVQASYTGSGTAMGLEAISSIKNISGSGSINASSEYTGDFASSAVGIRTSTVTGSVGINISADSSGYMAEAKGLELTQGSIVHTFSNSALLLATGTDSADAYGLYSHSSLSLTNTGNIKATASSADALGSARAAAIYAATGAISSLTGTGSLTSIAVGHADAYGVLADATTTLGSITLSGAQADGTTASIFVSSEEGDAIGAAAASMQAIASEIYVTTIDGKATGLASLANIASISELVYAQATGDGDATAVQLGGNLSITAAGQVLASAQTGTAIAVHLSNTSETSSTISNLGIVKAESVSGTAIALQVDGILDELAGEYEATTKSATAYAAKVEGDLGDVLGTFHLSGGGSTAIMYGVRSGGDIGNFNGSINTDTLLSAAELYGVSAAGSIAQLSRDVIIHNPTGNATAVQAQVVASINANITATTSGGTGAVATALELIAHAGMQPAELSFADGTKLEGYTKNASGEVTDLGYSIHADGRDVNFSSQTTTGFNPSKVNASLKGDIVAATLQLKTGLYEVDAKSLVVDNLILGTRDGSSITNETRMNVGNSVEGIVNLVSTNIDFHVSSFDEHSRLTVAQDSILNFTSMESINTYLGDTYWSEREDVIITLVDGPLTGLTEDWLDANIRFTRDDGALLTRSELFDEMVYVLYEPEDGLFLVPLRFIPEPSAASLSILALAALCARRRRKKD